jgi:hypothetical protein
MITLKPYQVTTPSDHPSHDGWIMSLASACRFIIKIAHGIDDQFARLVYTDEELLAHVHNKLVWFEPILRRERHVIGRLWNRLLREHMEDVVLDGVVILQLHELIGERVPDGLKANMRYLVHHEDVRALKERALMAMQARENKDVRQ